MSSHKTQNDGGYKVQRMQKLESISDYRSLRGGVFERQLKLNKIENLKDLPKINLLKTKVYVKNSSIVLTHWTKRCDHLLIRKVSKGKFHYFTTASVKDKSAMKTSKQREQSCSYEQP